MKLGLGLSLVPLKSSVVVPNNAPMITAPESFNTPVNFEKTITGVSVSDADNPVALTVTIACSAGTVSLLITTGLSFTDGDGTEDASMTFNGSVANVNSALAEFNYQPVSLGAPTITITVTDGVDEDSAIILGNIQDAVIEPTINGPTTIEAYTGYDYVFSGSAINVSDPDSSTLIITIDTGTSDANCTLASTTGLTFIQGDGTEDSLMEFNGTIANINEALNGLIFRTDVDGTYNLSIDADDGWFLENKTITCDAAEPQPVVKIVTISDTENFVERAGEPCVLGMAFEVTSTAWSGITDFIYFDSGSPSSAANALKSNASIAGELEGLLDYHIPGTTVTYESWVFTVTFPAGAFVTDFTKYHSTTLMPTLVINETIDQEGVDEDPGQYEVVRISVGSDENGDYTLDGSVCNYQVSSGVFTQCDTPSGWTLSGGSPSGGSSFVDFTRNTAGNVDAASTSGSISITVLNEGSDPITGVSAIHSFAVVPVPATGGQYRPSSTASPITYDENAAAIDVALEAAAPWGEVTVSGGPLNSGYVVSADNPGALDNLSPNNYSLVCPAISVNIT